MHGHEARAETAHAGEILVARRLVDRALAAELGLDRHDRDAVRLHAAIAAALAHGLVDDHALGRILHRAALAPAALLGGAGLVVDQHTDALRRGKLALHTVELVPMLNGYAGRDAGAARIFIRLVGDDDDAADAFGGELLGQARHGQRTV